MTRENIAEFTSLRDRWVFDYPLERIVAAVRAKISFHQSRVGHYSARMDEVMANIRERGITIQEVIDDPFSNATSYRMEAAQIDPELNRQMSDVQKKRKHHQMRVMEYTRWLDNLTAGVRPTHLPLTIDDVEFFGL